MDTDRLIRSLADDVGPVTPLRRPLLRTVAWMAIAVVYLAVLVAVMSPREDLARRMQEPRFLVEQTAALLTGLTGAAAAFATVVPGYPRRRVLLLPLLPLTVWVGTVTVGALGEYAVSGAAVLTWQFDWACVRTILAGASVPGIAMGLMLQRGAAVTPRISAAFGVLAAAGLGNLGVCLFHPHSSDLILLFWHCGTVLAFTAVAGLAGAQLLRWPTSRVLVLR